MKNNKTAISFCLVLFALTSYKAQNTYSLLNPAGGLRQDNSTFNNVNSVSANKSLSYNEIKGSPYYNKNFLIANFISSNNKETAPARYDAYTDNIEFKKDDQIYALPQVNDFTRVEFANTKDVLVKLELNDPLSGYFFELVKGKTSLYKKVKIKFVDAINANSSYTSDKPASFKTLEPIFYIKTNDSYIKEPKNKKQIEDAFPDKKENLATFFKTNKIKLDKEEDLIRLVNFLNEN